MRALDGHPLGGPGVPSCFYQVSGFSQGSLQEALNFDFILHQQNPHVLMLIHSRSVPRWNRHLWQVDSRIRRPTR
jgi:hypothetical protein